MATSKKASKKTAKKVTTAAKRTSAPAKKSAAMKRTATAKKSATAKKTATAKKRLVKKTSTTSAASATKAKTKAVAEPVEVAAKKKSRKPSAELIRQFEEPKKVKSRKTPANMRSGLRNIKKVLLTKRHLLFAQLQAELKEMERPEKRHRADLEEIASDTHDSDSLCQIMDINASQLDQIDAALKKIDESTYGICEDCDQEISLPRLEALPFATHCIECKRKSELSQVRPAEYYSAGFEQ